MMIKRNFLKPVTATAVIFGLVQFYGAAQASASMFRAPQSPWSVGPIAAQGAGGATYCSLKNAYSGGRTLVFARDNQGNNSIAVNFGRNMFHAHHKYNVKVRSGHTVRRVDALAASSKILVMETGIDTVLYDAISDHHDISFTTSRRTYGFDLNASVADGLTALGNCTDALKNGGQFAAKSIPLVRKTVKVAERPHHYKSAVRSEEAALKRLPLSSRNQQKKQIAQQVLGLIDQNQNPAPPAAKPAPVVASAPVAAVLKKPVPLNSAAASAKQSAPVKLVPPPAAPAAATASSQPAPVKLIPPTPAPAATASSQPAPANLVPPQPEQPVMTASNESAPEPPVPPVPVNPPPVAVPPPMPAPPQQDVAENSSLSLKGLLKTAHIASDNQIKISDSGMLQWMGDGLFGSAQQLSVGSGASMKMLAKRYLQKTADICTGQYAKKVDKLQQVGDFNVLKADVTCVDGKNNAAAAILFLSGRGQFSVITQEGTADQLSTAMADRDAIIAAVSSSAKD